MQPSPGSDCQKCETFNKIRGRIAKSAKHSPKSEVCWQKVRKIQQNQGSDGQKCETFVKIKGRTAKSVKHFTKSGVGWRKVRNIEQKRRSDGQECEIFNKIRGRMAKIVTHSSKSGIGLPKVWSPCKDRCKDRSVTLQRSSVTFAKIVGHLADGQKCETCVKNEGVVPTTNFDLPSSSFHHPCPSSNLPKAGPVHSNTQLRAKGTVADLLALLHLWSTLSPRC